MSKRALTVWVDCEAETCGECAWKTREVCGDLIVRPRCKLFGKGLSILSTSAGKWVTRCGECIAADSKALSVAGVAHPKRDSSGGYEMGLREKTVTE